MKHPSKSSQAKTRIVGSKPYKVRSTSGEAKPTEVLASVGNVGRLDQCSLNPSGRTLVQFLREATRR